MCFTLQRRALLWHLNFHKWYEPGVIHTFWLPNVLRATAPCTLSTSQLPKVFRERRAVILVTSKNVLRATRACTFSTFFDISTSKSRPRMVCVWHILTLFASKCASRHNGARLFDILTFQQVRICSVFSLQMRLAPQQRAIFYLSSGQLAPHRAYLPTLRSHKHWKNTVFRDLLTFLRTCIFSLLTFSLSELLHLLSSSFWHLLTFSMPELPPSYVFPCVHIVGSLISKLLSAMPITETCVTCVHAPTHEVVMVFW